MNRRGFLGALAALTLAPKDVALPALAPAAPAALPLLTGLARWLPVACVVGAAFCPRDTVYVIEPDGVQAGMRMDTGEQVQFFGLDRTKPTIIAHPAHVDEIRAGIEAAVARVARAAESGPGMPCA